MTPRDRESRSQTRSPEPQEEVHLRRSHKEHRRRNNDDAAAAAESGERHHKDKEHRGGRAARDLSESAPVISPHKAEGEEWRAALTHATEKTKKRIAKHPAPEEERPLSQSAHEKEIEMLLAKALAERQQGVQGLFSTRISLSLSLAILTTTTT